MRLRVKPAMTVKSGAVITCVGAHNMRPLSDKRDVYGEYVCPTAGA